MALVYIYYAISQKEANLKEIFNELLEKNKRRLYKRWGFDISKFEELKKSYSTFDNKEG
jgi:hypothetical protein